MSLAEKIISFNKNLMYTGAPLPPGIGIMNPFQNTGTMKIVKAFYQKYYHDDAPRHLVLGINPGRFGAGHTGIPFTDPKRLKSDCGIEYTGKITHEPSSVFVYDVIRAYGGAEAFYREFYINSVCPLGFVAVDAQDREKNYNYYDNKALASAVTGFAVENIRKQIKMGIYNDVCFCFGTGRNETFLRRLNDQHHFFKTIVALEHPRFIMQYKLKRKQFYIDKYLQAFKAAGNLSGK